MRDTQPGGDVRHRISPLRDLLNRFDLELVRITFAAHDTSPSLKFMAQKCLQEPGRFSWSYRRELQFRNEMDNILPFNFYNPDTSGSIHSDLSDFRVGQCGRVEVEAATVE